MPEIIDAHQHFWQRSRPFDYRWLDAPSLAPIRRDFLPNDLAPHLKALGVQRSIVVQTQHDLKENDWALELAETSTSIAGVVGWVDLTSPDCGEQIQALKAHPKLVGVRHVVQDEPDDDFIVREDVLRGLGCLEANEIPFDLLFYVRHLRHATTLAARFPTLPMVIDHLAKPEIRAGRIEDWRHELRAAARYPNVFCKLSGMVTEANWECWTIDDLRPYVEEAIDAFGPSRLMFGSDWPVCLLAATYEQVVETLREILTPLSVSEKAEIFGGTATRFYKLPPV